MYRASFAAIAVVISSTSVVQADQTVLTAMQLDAVTAGASAHATAVSTNGGSAVAQVSATGNQNRTVVATPGPASNSLTRSAAPAVDATKIAIPTAAPEAKAVKTTAAPQAKPAKAVNTAATSATAKWSRLLGFGRKHRGLVRTITPLFHF